MSLYLSAPLPTSGPPFLEYKDPIPMDIHFHKGDVYFDFFVNRTLATDYEFYRYYNPIIYGNYVLLAERIEWPELDQIRGEITSIPTFILGGLYTHKGRVMIDFRFHNSDLQRVVGLVKMLVSISTDVRVTYMGKSDGLRAKLNEMQTRAQMSVARFTYADDSDKNYMMEWKGITEQRAAVSYGEGGKGETGRLDISRAPIEPLLLTLIRDQLPIVGYFENHDRGKVNSIAIFPSFLAKPFLVRYFELTENLKDIRLEYVESYGDVRDTI
jgi:hypothetical protein